MTTQLAMQLIAVGQIACPDCGGEREIKFFLDLDSSPCHACGGEGVVWPDDYTAYDDARRCRPEVVAA